MTSSKEMHENCNVHPLFMQQQVHIYSHSGGSVRAVMSTTMKPEGPGHDRASQQIIHPMGQYLRGCFCADI